MAPALVDAGPWAFTVGVDAGGLGLSNAGGDVGANGCELDSSANASRLPMGLVVATGRVGARISCIIQGVPTSASNGALTIGIRATNEAGRSTARVALVVNPAPLQAPSITAPRASLSLDEGIAIGDVLMVNAGGDVQANGCNIDRSQGKPGLPLSLAIATAPGSNGRQTCRLYGTPSVTTTGPVAVTILAANSAGVSSASLSISIAARALLAPDFASQSILEWFQGAPLTAYDLRNDGGSVAVGGCSISASGDALPAGLSLADVQMGGTRTCRLFGVPLDVAPDSVTVRITGRNASGADEHGLRLSIVASTTAPMPELADLGLMELYQGSRAGTASFVNDGGSVEECRLKGMGELPAGLGLVKAIGANSRVTCAIGGAPVDPSAMDVEIAIIASNRAGAHTATATATIRVSVPQAPDLLDVSTPVALRVGEALDEAIVLANLGGPVQSQGGCQVDSSGSKPQLPRGLVVEPVVTGAGESCQLSGSPEEASDGPIRVTLIGQNPSGSDSASLVLRVDEAAAAGTAGRF